MVSPGLKRKSVSMFLAFVLLASFILVSFSFSIGMTNAAASWWNSDWSFRKELVLNHFVTNVDLANFPALINVVDTDLKNKARTDGSDIVFTDSQNNKLNHEIESYDAATGHLVTWVSIPYLSAVTDTVIYMYYGNPSAVNQQNRTGVWDTGFRMVQHLEETSAVRADSTINGNNGTAYNMVKVQDIDGADYFNGVNSSISVPDANSLDPQSAITIEGWMNLSLTGNYINLVSKGSYGQYYLRLGPTAGYAYWYVKFSDGTATSIEGNIGWMPNTLHYVTATLDTQTSTIAIYLDGVPKLTGTFPGGKQIAGSSSVLMFSDSGSRKIKGMLDEIRVSGVARSSAWIQTCYKNQNNSRAFLIVGGEETPSSYPYPLVLSPSPSDGASAVSPSITQLSFQILSLPGNRMSCSVTTTPDIGSIFFTNLGNGVITVPVTGLKYSTTYTWAVSLTDGTYWTNETYAFTTLRSQPPDQTAPLLAADAMNNLGCNNQSTSDPEGQRVTNIYHWFTNGVSTTNLLLPFETNSSTLVQDYSGYGNNGVIHGNVQWTNNGIVGGAYAFNRGFIQIAGSSTLDGGGTWTQLTVECWIYLTASQSNTRIISRIPSYEIGLSGNKLFASLWVIPNSSMPSGYNGITYGTPLLLNTWYHVAFTYNGTTLALYLNGTRVVASPISLPYGIIQSSGSNPLYIGWFNYFQGKIDEVRVYPTALSSQQIIQRYTETKSGQSSASTIVSQQTTSGQTWVCAVTPNDSDQDGITLFSNSITIH